MSKRLLIFLNILAVAALLLAYLSTHISPEKVAFFALFGIAYGVLLITNVVFIVFWLLVKKRLALLSAIAIIIGVSHLSAYMQLIPKFSDAETEGQKIKIVSQNVKLFGWYNWRHNKQDRDTMIAGLQRADADIYCFQEYFHNTTPGKFDTRETITKRLKTPYSDVHYTNSINMDEKYGIVTYSKYPIVNMGRVTFDREYSNTCIFSDIDVNGDTIRVYNAHVASIRFQNEDYRFMDEIKKTEQPVKPVIQDGIGIVDRLTVAYKKRASQVRSIKAHAAESPYPVIICGDFNDTPVSYSYAQLSEGMVDSFRESGWGIGNTYIGKFPSFRIDYIFHSPQLHSRNYHKLPEKVSDHHGITAEMYWE